MIYTVPSINHLIQFKKKHSLPCIKKLKEEMETQSIRNAVLEHKVSNASLVSHLHTDDLDSNLWNNMENTYSKTQEDEKGKESLGKPTRRIINEKISM